MATYAIIQSGTGDVTNVVVADPNTAAQQFPGAVQIDGHSPMPGIGWRYSGGVFTPPTAPAPTPTTTFSKFGFRSLFTLPELIGIDNYASNGSLSSDQLQTLKTVVTNFTIADQIDLTDPATQQGVEYLVSCGLLTQPRANTILAGEPPTE